MSREIIFRGRTVSESEYLDDGEWIEGFYTCFNGEEHRIYTGYAITDCGDYYPDWVNVIPETVGQFTGLTDKNGKRIFEGDIVKCIDITRYKENEYISPVVFLDGSWFLHESEDCDVYLYNYESEGVNSLSEIEVIGNIHDNPELLNDEREGE